MSIIKHNGLLLLDGKFWTIQRGDVAPNKFDRFFNPRLEWPGRSVFFEREQAEQIATKLASKYTEYPFIVMEASAAFAAAQQPVVKRSL